MPGGFSSPTILFLNTWDAPERSFCRKVFAALPARGYTRYVEPCSGAFAMPLVAAAAGWKAPAMECSDVSLFSSIVGTLLAGGDLDQLEVRFDNEPVWVNHDEKPSAQAAGLLWLQLWARMLVRPEFAYWRALVEDLERRRQEHITSIADRLDGLLGRLGGLTYQPRDMWAHIEAVADDPHTVISINPPTYRGGFEKFFDTGGRLTWSSPPYEVFDPVPDIPRLIALMEGKPALLVCQQQREPGQSAHPRPVFARHLSLGQYVYLNSNRPDEVFTITGGPRVATRDPLDLSPAAVPMLGFDQEIRDDMAVQLLPVKAAVADWYRNLWMHRLVAVPGTFNLLVLLDGHAAGVIGYSTDSMTMTFPGASKWSRHVIMRYAFGAPHATMRLTRLATALALLRSTLERYRNPKNTIVLAVASGVVTVEYTRHPEAKGLRGLMKLANRQDHPDGYKLVYAAPWSDSTPAQVLAEWLRKEERWQATASKSAPASS